MDGRRGKEAMSIPRHLVARDKTERKRQAASSPPFPVPCYSISSSNILLKVDPQKRHNCSYKYCWFTSSTSPHLLVVYLKFIQIPLVVW